MSWQSKFDAGGPRWEGNAAAIAEEKRFEKMMEELRASRNTKRSVDQTKLNELDDEMKRLYLIEKELVHVLENTLTEHQRKEIKSHISTLRKHFYEIKDEYVRLRNG